MKDSHSFDPGSNPGTSTFLTEHALSPAFLEKSLNCYFQGNGELSRATLSSTSFVVLILGMSPTTGEIAGHVAVLSFPAATQKSRKPFLRQEALTLEYG